MSEYLFLYKDNLTNDVYYIENNPMHFECNHYFGELNLHGSCFSIGFNKDMDYENITTILSPDDFKALMDFNKAIKKLGYGIAEGDERYNQGVELCGSIRPIFEKLNSDENQNLFNTVAEQEMEWLKD